MCLIKRLLTSPQDFCQQAAKVRFSDKFSVFTDKIVKSMTQRRKKLRRSWNKAEAYLLNICCKAAQRSFFNFVSAAIAPKSLANKKSMPDTDRI